MNNPTWFYDKSFIYHIDSNDKQSGEQQDCNIKIDIPNANLRDFDSVVVLSASVPKSYYAFHEPHNTFQFQLFNLSSGAIIETRTITISPGTYSATEMVKNIKEQLNSSYPSFNWNINVEINQGKFSFIYTDTNITQSGRFIFDNKETADRLGFDIGSTDFYQIGGPSGTDRTIPVNYVMDMSPENDVYIRSNIVSGGVNANEDILIDLQGSKTPPFGRIQFYNPEPHQYTKDLNHTTQIFNFRITDENNQILDLNGKNWTMTLIFFKKSSLPEKINDLIKLIANNF